MIESHQIITKILRHKSAGVCLFLRPSKTERDLRKAFWPFLAFACFGLASSAEAAGIQLFDHGPNLSGAIWYPCRAAPKQLDLGELGVGADYGLVGVKDCPVTGAKLPLVVVSHGYIGWFGGHHDTAAALADAGFVVAAINHPGDTTKDSTKSDDLSSYVSRPADMVRLLDFLLHDWKDRAVLDPARIGLFGFSKGGYTGLALIGAAPDFGRVARGCTDHSKFCEQLSRGDIPTPPHDARIRAAVIADPIPGFFTQSNLAAIGIPVQYWRAEVGIGIIDPNGTARVARALPEAREVHDVPASHFAFLAPCSPQLAAALPRICTDKPASFDRAAFHREFNASVAQFLRDHLVPDSSAR